jgi:hypothetical protein
MKNNKQLVLGPKGSTLELMLLQQTPEARLRFFLFFYFQTF